MIFYSVKKFEFNPDAQPFTPRSVAVHTPTPQSTPAPQPLLAAHATPVQMHGIAVNAPQAIPVAQVAFQFICDVRKVIRITAAMLTKPGFRQPKKKTGFFHFYRFQSSLDLFGHAWRRLNHGRSAKCGSEKGACCGRYSRHF